MTLIFVVTILATHSQIMHNIIDKYSIVIFNVEDENIYVLFLKIFKNVLS